MSKFLGPIHKWVFNKVIFLEGLNQDLLTFAKNHNIEIACQNLTFDYQAELEEIVDLTNIHGSLQAMINEVEFRLKDITISLLKTIDLTELKEVAYNYGLSNSISNQTNTEEVFKALDDLLVSGMPCDRLNIIKEKDDNKLVYSERIQLFDQYWLDSNVEYFYQLRESLIKGLLAKSDFNYRQDSKQFIIERV